MQTMPDTSGEKTWPPLDNSLSKDIEDGVEMVTTGTACGRVLAPTLPYTRNPM